MTLPKPRTFAHLWRSPLVSTGSMRLLCPRSLLVQVLVPPHNRRRPPIRTLRVRMTTLFSWPYRRCSEQNLLAWPPLLPDLRTRCLPPAASQSTLIYPCHHLGLPSPYRLPLTRSDGQGRSHSSIRDRVAAKYPSLLTGNRSEFIVRTEKSGQDRSFVPIPDARRHFLATSM